jgi:hypothetical protein
MTEGLKGLECNVNMVGYTGQPPQQLAGAAAGSSISSENSHSSCRARWVRICMEEGEREGCEDEK